MSLEDLQYLSEEEGGDGEGGGGWDMNSDPCGGGGSSEEPTYSDLESLHGLLMQFDGIYLNNRLMDLEAGLSSDSESDGSEAALLEDYYESLMDNWSAATSSSGSSSAAAPSSASAADLSDPGDVTQLEE